MKSINIFLAEDNEGDVFLVRQALDEHAIEHEMYVARDGAAAMAFMARMGKPGYPRCPDVMLLDLNLPKADGAQVLREFHKHPECVGTPVIVFSSSGAEKDRSRMAELGISHYFQKPSDLDAFLRLGAIVRELANGSGGRDVG